MDSLPPPPHPPPTTAGLRCPDCGQGVIVQLELEGGWPELTCCPNCGAVLLLNPNESSSPLGLVAEVLEPGVEPRYEGLGGIR